MYILASIHTKKLQLKGKNSSRVEGQAMVNRITYVFIIDEPKEKLANRSEMQISLKNGLMKNKI